jgi:soluble lytic murein transglycosylase
VKELEIFLTRKKAGGKVLKLRKELEIPSNSSLSKGRIKAGIIQGHPPAALRLCSGRVLAGYPGRCGDESGGKGSCFGSLVMTTRVTRFISTLLGILFSLYIYNLTARADIDCQSILLQSVQDKESSREKYKKGYCYIQLERFEEGVRALSGLENELNIIADYVIYYRALGDKGLGNMASAERQFRSILTNYPSSGLKKRTLTNLAEIYSNKGDYEKAQNMFRSLYAEERDPLVRASLLNDIAQSLEGQKKYKEALSTYRQLWVEFPESRFSEGALAKADQISDREGIPFVLSDYDYLSRAERLFKLTKWESALRHFERLPIKDDDTRLKIAIIKYRIGQLDEASSILAGITSPESLYWMSKVSLKQGRDQEASEILKQISLFYPNSDLAPEALYNAARLYQVNLDFKKALELYDLLLRKYPNNEFAEDAAWNLGWIHYRNGRLREALITFSSFTNTRSVTNSARATYWKARVLEKIGRKGEAFNIYETLSRSYNPTYYSYLALKKVGSTRGFNLSPDSYTKTDVVNKVSLRKNRAELLIELSMFDDAILEIQEFEKEATNTGELIEVSKLYNRAAKFNHSIKIAQDIRLPEAYWLSYPKGFGEIVRLYSGKYQADELVIYSIIREESRFQEDAVSPSGAIGLMQIIPDTGIYTAGKVGISGYTTDMLYTPIINIQLGIAYFQEVLQQYNGVVHLAIASYNAGPHVVVRWVEKLKNLETDEFIEEIPYGETRNYVKRVLRSYGVYKAIYDKGS